MSGMNGWANAFAWIAYLGVGLGVADDFYKRYKGREEGEGVVLGVSIFLGMIWPVTLISVVVGWGLGKIAPRATRKKNDDDAPPDLPQR